MQDNFLAAVFMIVAFYALYKWIKHTPEIVAQTDDIDPRILQGFQGFLKVIYAHIAAGLEHEDFRKSQSMIDCLRAVYPDHYFTPAIERVQEYLANNKLRYKIEMVRHIKVG